MAAVDTTAKEMEALHVGQNDEMNVSSCSSLEFLCFHAPWNESLMLFQCFYKKGECIFFWHLFENQGIIFVSRVGLDVWF